MIVYWQALRYHNRKVVDNMAILLVPVVMACAAIGTIGMVKGINRFNNRNK